MKINLQPHLGMLAGFVNAMQYHQYLMGGDVTLVQHFHEPVANTSQRYLNRLAMTRQINDLRTRVLLNLHSLDIVGLAAFKKDTQVIRKLTDATYKKLVRAVVNSKAAKDAAAQ